jgi:hypothetical protein
MTKPRGCGTTGVGLRTENASLVDMQFGVRYRARVGLRANRPPLNLPNASRFLSMTCHLAQTLRRALIPCLALAGISLSSCGPDGREPTSPDSMPPTWHRAASHPVWPRPWPPRRGTPIGFSVRMESWVPQSGSGLTVKPRYSSLPSHPACADSRQGSTEYQCR